MVGTVSKGNRIQVMARKLLERDGYTVHTAVRSSQRVGPPSRPFWISQTTDIFNAFDLIGTRMDSPRPLRFVQVTTKNLVSERIKKVDPVPINPAVASVEIWAYVGGQKRLDRRYKEKKVWLPRNYFQVYFKERNWEPDPRERLFVGEGEFAENEEKRVVNADPLPTVTSRRKRASLRQVSTAG